MSTGRARNFFFFDFTPPSAPTAHVFVMLVGDGSLTTEERQEQSGLVSGLIADKEPTWTNDAATTKISAFGPLRDPVVAASMPAKKLEAAEHILRSHAISVVKGCVSVS